MLKKLTVSNLAIVEKAEVEFGPGLNVITGETGAGKSVLMGALELVLGARAEASIVREGAKEAEVEAEFDDKVIRRTVTAQGRSRAWLDDESVAVAELKDIGRKLVDIHGPRANQLILEEDFQRGALDAFAGVSLSAYAEVWQELQALESETAALLAGGSEDERDLLRYQVGEIEAAQLTEDDETVAERHAAAAHAGEIVDNANLITDALGGDESEAEILIRLQPKFAEIARLLPEAEVWKREAEELTLKLQELSRTVADAVSRLDAGEESLEELDRRLTVVNRLKRKYGATVAEILEKFNAKKAKLDALEHRGERLEELRAQAAQVEKRLRTAAARLTAARAEGAAKLGKAVTRELKDLGFLQARFHVAVTPIEPTAHGADRVVFMFEPNPGEPSRPLAAIASSGEIARVMLALKSVLAAHDATGVLVFDEIDANIGGEVGKTVGEKLRLVSRHRQVVAITHLPQSAVYGERHLVVSKTVSGGRTRTQISPVDGDARVAEIARMLGGEKLTSVVKRHAEELLQLSR